MPLTQSAIYNAEPRSKPYKLSDGDRLYLLITPGGSKLWRYSYIFGGRENTLTIGAFPEVGLDLARKRKHDAKKLIAEGTDPNQAKRLDKHTQTKAAKNTFGVIAAEYLANLKANGMAEATISKNTWLLENLAAQLTDRPIAKVTPFEILEILKKIEKTGRRESAKRLRGIMGAVFRYAIVTLRATQDPTAALRGALLKPIVKHRPAITDERQVGALMRCIDDYDGWPTIRAALLLTALTMTRPGDIRGMKRSEINFERSLWRIPAERMKMRRPHDVPLSRQAIAILKDVWPLSEGHDYVLSSIRTPDRTLSEVAMNMALRRMGYTKDEMVAHGFRAKPALRTPHCTRSGIAIKLICDTAHARLANFTRVLRGSDAEVNLAAAAGRGNLSLIMTCAFGRSMLRHFTASGDALQLQNTQFPN